MQKNFTWFVVWAMTVSGVFLFRCSSDSSESSSAEYVALPDGEYSMSSPVCADTAAEPEYPEPGQFTPAIPVILRDFDDLTSHTGTLAGESLIEILEDEDCKLTISQTISSNKGGELTLIKKTSYAFEPADCKLTATAAGVKVEAGQDYFGGKIFADTDSEDIAGLLTIEAGEDGAYTTTTPAIADFGCGEVGKFQITMTPVEAAE